LGAEFSRFNERLPSIKSIVPDINKPSVRGEHWVGGKLNSSLVI